MPADALTLDPSQVTHLASAGVQVLHRVAATLVGNGQTLPLYNAPGSLADSVLTLAGPPRTPEPPRPSDENGVGLLPVAGGGPGQCLMRLRTARTERSSRTGSVGREVISV